MRRIDDSDLAWIVYADWLTDHGRDAEADEIRCEVTGQPNGTGWHYEWFGVGVGGVGGVGVVGGGGGGGVVGVGGGVGGVVGGGGGVGGGY